VLLLATPLDYIVNLPHPLELLWLAWLIALPWQLRNMFGKDSRRTSIATTGELMSFREIVAVGCLGGFVLLTFIFTFCAWLTWKAAGLI
jgi:hypothetical protein